MRSSRTPEHRSGSSRLVLLVGLFILVVGLGLAITYFTQGFGSLSAETTEPVPAVTETEALVEPEVVSEPSAQGQSEASTAIVVPEGSANEPSSGQKIESAAPEVSMNESDETPKLESAVDVEAKPGEPDDTLKIEDIESAGTDAGEAKTEEVTDEQTPISAQETGTERNLEFLPQVQFGEVLGEGLVELPMPNGDRVDTWYTFQVDTKSGEIIVYFALFDEEKQSILSTVRVDDYSKGNDLTRAEVTLFYEDGMQRIVGFDGVAGTMALTQRYNVPYGPSIFSPELRRSMVYYGMELQDAEGDASLDLDLDVSGLSDGEKLSFMHSAPAEVETALEELKSLVSYIEVVRQG